LLFFSNVLWVLCLIPGLAADPANPVSFWQIYFLTTPHRWITLLLVATDRDRRDGRDRLFLALAVIAVGAVAATYFATGTLLCLALIDTVWNAWHFGSQHAGVLRIYGRKVGGGWPAFEKHATRLFVAYVSLRVPGWVTGALRADSTLDAAVRVADLVILSIPLGLIAVQLVCPSRAGLGKLVYTCSFSAAYAGLLFAVRADAGPFVFAFALATAIFHATEYLAIVTHYAWRRQSGGPGAFRTMAANWGLVLVLFAGGLGLFESVFGSSLGDLWVGANLAAAFLHYAYDGLIWKLRKHSTASALGVP
jgi:hypothetical protein